MSDSFEQAESHTLRGAIDRPALLTIRGIIEGMEPLAMPGLDDYLNPSILEVTLEDGLCEAEEATLEIRWTTEGDYAFYYTDTDAVNLRWKTTFTGETTFTRPDQNSIIHRPMRVQTRVGSKRLVSHSLPKRWSLVLFSHSGGSRTTQTRMNHSTRDRIPRRL